MQTYNLTPEECRILGALKKDPMTSSDLSLFSNGVQIANRLVFLGLANAFKEIYSISQAGHKYKPTPVLNNANQLPAKPASKVETISLNAVIDISKPAPKPKPIKQEATAMTTELNPLNEANIIDPSQPRVWRMMKLIATQGKVTSLELAKLIDEKYASNIQGYLTSYTIGENAVLHVTKNTDENNPSFHVYSFIEGKTFDDFLNRKAKSQSQKGAGQRKIEPVKKDAKPDIPQFLRKTDDLEAADRVDEKLDATPKSIEFCEAKPVGVGVPGTIANRGFKAAITSAGTIMMFGLTEAPIELSPAHTKTLVDFISHADLEGLLV